jgi:16S rRNA (cytosine967-C5)-methyltransferase
MVRAKVSTPRLAALAILCGVLEEDLNLSEAESANTLPDARDRAFARYLSYGVLRWLSALEWLAGQLLRKPLKRKDQDVQRLILIGLFQLWKEAAAPHAAINENAESARIIGKPWAVAVINAVLRRFQREQDEWLSLLETKEARYAHPEWLLDLLKNDWPEDWETIAFANNRAAPLWLRLNQGSGEADTSARLESAGFDVEPHSVVAGAVKISPAVAVNSLPGFEQGRISVQDPAAQLAAGLLEVRDGDRILDACAAPGGKTCHILELASRIDLTALDKNPKRLELVAENLDRLGFRRLGNVHLIAADAANPAEWWDGVPFNSILLDAPCTATGVIRRHPEIKWLRTPGQLHEAVRLQAGLLRKLWPLLEAGGMLLYATCSVLKLENSVQIQQFIEHHQDVELVEMDVKWGRNLSHGRQILPGEQDMDGFFYASLRKKT